MQSMNRISNFEEEEEEQDFVYLWNIQTQQHTDWHKEPCEGLDPEYDLSSCSSQGHQAKDEQASKPHQHDDSCDKCAQLSLLLENGGDGSVLVGEEQDSSSKYDHIEHRQGDPYCLKGGLAVGCILHSGAISFLCSINAVCSNNDEIIVS